jgi:hypothetical protein
MVSEGYDGVDSPWNLSNAVQVNEPKNSIWTRVTGDVKSVQYRADSDLRFVDTGLDPHNWRVRSQEFSE